MKWFQAYRIMIVIVVLWLVACGRANDGAALPAIVQAGNHSVAELLGNPPPVNQPIELDAYIVRNNSSPSFPPGEPCPIPVDVVTDAPFAGTIH